MFELGLTERIPCTTEENYQFKLLEQTGKSLPPDIFADESEGNNIYYRIHNIDFTDEEFNKLIMLQQTNYLRSINDSMLFFVILTIISLVIFIALVVYFFFFMGGFS
jgi:hypothetical protein